jgi:hypothetical protein
MFSATSCTSPDLWQWWHGVLPPVPESRSCSRLPRMEFWRTTGFEPLGSSPALEVQPCGNKARASSVSTAMPDQRPFRNGVYTPLLRGLAVLALGMALPLCVMSWMVCMPGRSSRMAAAPAGHDDTAHILRAGVQQLAGDIGERNVAHPERLQQAAQWLREQLQRSQHPVREQTYPVAGFSCTNLEVELPGTDRRGEIVVVGAHYDSALGSPGANDNASGAVALALLTQRLAAGPPLSKTVRFVAFVNEEPPYFQTSNMGSRQYAQRCRDRAENVIAMLSLETIGYYTDVPNSQNYPFPFSLAYPSTGDFIAFVGDRSSRDLVRRAVGSFRTHTRFPSEGGALPENLPGVGWSDHESFWKVGYPAVMVTDTAPFRYPWYHTASDTPDKIDYDRLSRVVSALTLVIADLASGPGGSPPAEVPQVRPVPEPRESGE